MASSLGTCAGRICNSQTVRPAKHPVSPGDVRNGRSCCGGSSSCSNAAVRLRCSNPSPFSFFRIPLSKAWRPAETAGKLLSSPLRLTRPPPSLVRCNFSGGDKWSPRSSSPPSSTTPGGLILPGGSSSSSSSSSSSTPPGGGLYLPFLRPADPSPTGKLSMEEMLDILRERRGLWHEYVPYISALTRMGLTPSSLADATGILAVEQNVMVVAAQVHGSLKEQGCEALYFYDNDGGKEVLYELRVLAVSQRRAAAEYVAQQNMDAKGAREVAKAMKEYERRKREEGREAFSFTPADCLAFAFYRQSKETKSPSEKESNLKKALVYASTDSAIEQVKAALKKLRDPGSGSGAVDVVAESVAATLPTVRLRTDESFPKPLLVLGYLSSLAARDFEEAAAGGGGRVQLEWVGRPGVSTPAPDAAVEDGARGFEMFRPSKAGQLWMAVPSWPVIAGGRALVGVVSENADAVPSLKGRGVKDPVLLVVETEEEGVEREGAAGCFLVAQGAEDGGGVGIVVGSRPREGESKCLGRVLAVLLPPKEGQEEDDMEIEDWE